MIKYEEWLLQFKDGMKKNGIEKLDFRIFAPYVAYAQNMSAEDAVYQAVIAYSGIKIINENERM